MGCKVSPLLAIIRVYAFEKRVLYVDQHYISVPYGRYVDDAYTIASSLEEAECMFNQISKMDPDNRLQWEIEFPDSDSRFIPFLGTQTQVENTNISYKFYRKPQKKNIVLHFMSHHSLRTKVEVAKNFYRTAEQSSSSPELAEESRLIIDNLLRCNGYSNPREFIATRKGISTGFKKDKESRNVNLKLPYLSEYVSSQIVKFTKKHQLPVNIIFSPGTKLRDIFCSSRPYEKTVCMNNNSTICNNLEGGNCIVKAPVYQITCLLCMQNYVGESGRSAHDRLIEHLRYAKHPNCNSYSEEAFAVHYKEQHPNTAHQLQFKILTTESNTIRRKILEAFIINTIQPEINNKDECLIIRRFLV